MKKVIKQLLLDDKTTEAKELIFASLNQDNKNDPELYLFLGTAFAIESNNDLAIQYFNKAFEIAPDNYDVISTIANFLITNGQNKDAQKLMDNYLNSFSSPRETTNNNSYIEEIFGTPKQPPPSIDEFNYYDFILGGGDALNYEYSSKTDISSPSPEVVIIPPPVLPRLLFTMYGWNEHGGGTTLPKSITKELVQRGFEVAVFYELPLSSPTALPYQIEKTIEDGVKLFGFSCRSTITLEVCKPQKEINDANVVSLFQDVLDEFQPDIINFHNFVGFLLR